MSQDPKPDGRRAGTFPMILQAVDRIHGYNKDARKLINEHEKNTSDGIRGVCERLGRDVMAIKFSALLARTLVVAQKMTRPGSISLSDFPLLAEEWELADRAETDADDSKPAPKEAQ